MQLHGQLLKLLGHKDVHQTCLSFVPGLALNVCVCLTHGSFEPFIPALVSIPPSLF